MFEDLVVYDCNPACKRKTSLDCITIYRPAWDTDQDPVSENKTGAPIILLH